jgi:hypothetical protein
LPGVKHHARPQAQTNFKGRTWISSINYAYLQIASTTQKQ